MRAQFSPAFQSNESYWGDLKAEVDFYDAQVMIDHQLRHGELQMILTPFILTGSGALPPKPTNADWAAALPIRLSQTLTLPCGLMNEQRASTVLFRQDRVIYADFSMANLDGTLFRHAQPGSPESKGLAIETFPGSGVPSILPDSKETPRILRQELPFRIRTLDFSKPTGEFAVLFVDLSSPTNVGQPTDVPAKLSFKTGDREIAVEIRLEGGATEHVTLDRNFPFLLREWKTADGSVYKLKNSLKADYHQYLKEGDREKALKDPMLRHPD